MIILPWCSCEICVSRCFGQPVKTRVNELSLAGDVGYFPTGT